MYCTTSSSSLWIMSSGFSYQFPKGCITWVQQWLRTVRSTRARTSGTSSSSGCFAAVAIVSRALCLSPWCWNFQHRCTVSFWLCPWCWNLSPCLLMYFKPTEHFPILQQHILFTFIISSSIWNHQIKLILHSPLFFWPLIVGLIPQV